jgi:alkylhydroperoxidase/carboxymuconolactone decarboxylase family protein YurZ
MKLQSQDQVMALDADFGQMAVYIGQHAWGLPELSIREKTFVFVAADMCCHNLGMPIETHARMGMANGVPVADVREAIRHLAPYAGYPTAAEALFRLADLEDPDAGPGEQARAPADHVAQPAVELPAATLNELTELDPAFAAFYQHQFDGRWNRDTLTVRERALATLAADVLYQTLDDSFRLHIDIARTSGAADEQIRAVLRLLAEYSIEKTRRAFAALTEYLARDASGHYAEEQPAVRARKA